MAQADTPPKGLALTNQELDNAFLQNAFSLVFQPQVATHGGDIFGAETFVRWDHPEFGFIPPTLFVSFIENQGRSRELTNYVLRRATEAASKWHRSDLNWTTTVNVNLSDLADGTLPVSIDILVRELNFDLTSLAIDVPESELALQWDRKWDNVSDTLKALKDLGVTTCLDSSGPHLLEPEKIDTKLFDVFKVGGAASLKFTNQTGKLQFGHVARRLDLAAAHGIKTMAVGAEDQATLLALKKFGFDYVQGHILSKALSTEHLAEWRRMYMPPTAFMTATPSQTNEVQEVALSSNEETDEITAEWSESVGAEPSGPEEILRKK